MSTAITLHQVEAPAVTGDQMELIKKTIAKDATPDELKLFFYDCARQGVHPLDKLLYFTKRKGKYVPVTSIDFMRTRAADSGDYAGNDDPRFDMDEKDKPMAATVTVYRMVQDQRCAFTATARWSEYKPDEDFMWKKMPFTMLGKCAEALALRKAFPRQLSGLYSAEEMDQAGKKAQAPESAGELAEPSSQSIRMGGIIEDETEKKDRSGVEWYWYKIKTLDADGEVTVVVASPKATDSGRLADKQGWLVDIEVIETDKPGVFTLVKVLNVRKPVTTNTLPATTEAPVTTFEQEMESEPVKPTVVAHKPTVEPIDAGLERLQVHIEEIDQRKSKKGAAYLLLQCLLEGAADSLAVHVWDSKLFDAVQALLGKDAVIGCERRETDDKIFYSLKAIYS